MEPQLQAFVDKALPELRALIDEGISSLKAGYFSKAAQKKRAEKRAELLAEATSKQEKAQEKAREDLPGIQGRLEYALREALGFKTSPSPSNKPPTLSELLNDETVLKRLEENSLGFAVNSAWALYKSLNETLATSPESRAALVAADFDATEPGPAQRQALWEQRSSYAQSLIDEVENLNQRVKELPEDSITAQGVLSGGEVVLSSRPYVAIKELMSVISNMQAEYPRLTENDTGETYSFEQTGRSDSGMEKTPLNDLFFEGRDLLDNFNSLFTPKGVNISCYADVKNPLVIDCKGADWQAIVVPVKMMDGLTKADSKRINDLNKALSEGTVGGPLGASKAAINEAKNAIKIGDNGDGTATLDTSTIAAWAKRNGYDGVIFENVVDFGGYGENYKDLGLTQEDMTTPGTDVVVFSNDQIVEIDDAAWAEQEGLKSDTKSGKIKELPTVFATTGETLSPQFQAAMRNKNLTAEEVDAIPEVKKALKENAEKKGRQTADELAHSSQRVQAQISNFLDKGSYSEEGRRNGPVAHERRIDIIIGPPGAGKTSTVVNRISQEHRSRICELDDYAEVLYGYAGGADRGYVQREASAVSDAIEKYAVNNGENVVFPVIGDNPESLLEWAQGLKAEGYSVYLTQVGVTKEAILSRQLVRFAETGRAPQTNRSTEQTFDRINETYNRLTQQEGLLSGQQRIWNDDPQLKPEGYQLRDEAADGVVRTGGRHELSSSGDGGAQGRERTAEGQSGSAVGQNGRGDTGGRFDLVGRQRRGDVSESDLRVGNQRVVLGEGSGVVDTTQESNSDLAKLEKELLKCGVSRVYFIEGSFSDESGNLTRGRCIQGNDGKISIYVRTDATVTRGGKTKQIDAGRLARHELMHGWLYTLPAKQRDATIKKLLGAALKEKGLGKRYQAVSEYYTRVYKQAFTKMAEREYANYTGEDRQQRIDAYVNERLKAVPEEIVCDIFGGIDSYGAKGSDYSAALKAFLKSAKSDGFVADAIQALSEGRSTDEDIAEVKSWMSLEDKIQTSDKKVWLMTMMTKTKTDTIKNFFHSAIANEDLEYEIMAQYENEIEQLLPNKYVKLDSIIMKGSDEAAEKASDELQNLCIAAFLKDLYDDNLSMDKATWFSATPKSLMPSSPRLRTCF